MILMDHVSVGGMDVFGFPLATYSFKLAIAVFPAIRQVHKVGDRGRRFWFWYVDRIVIMVAPRLGMSNPSRLYSSCNTQTSSRSLLSNFQCHSV
jgi:hypothetical protein